MKSFKSSSWFFIGANQICGATDWLSWTFASHVLFYTAVKIIFASETKQTEEVKYFRCFVGAGLVLLLNWAKI